MALLDQDTLAADPVFQKRVLFSLLNYVTGTVLGETTNEVQSLAITGGTPVSGNFFVSGGPLVQTINPVFNETAGGLQAKIEAALDVGGRAVCTGGPLPGTAIAINFGGTLGNSPQGLMAVGASTLSAGTAAVTRTAAGVAAVRNAERRQLAARVIAGPPAFAGPFVQMVTTNATVMSAYTGGSNQQTAVSDAQINAAVAAVFNAFLGG